MIVASGWLRQRWRFVASRETRRRVKDAGGVVRGTPKEERLSNGSFQKHKP